MNVIIAGAGRLGTQIAQVLAATHNEVTLIDADDDRVATLEGRVPVRLIAGDACEPTLLEHAGALTAVLVIATTGDDEDNLVISLLAKRQFSVPRVAARFNDADNARLFDGRWGVDVAVPAATPLISLIEEATGATDTVALLRLSKGRRRRHRNGHHTAVQDGGPCPGRRPVARGDGRRHDRPRRTTDRA
ncbi:potassium channel family protein [Streptomyces lutosisoli]|uniref:Potassium channel family protein n=1 Tax=Streptomyces lutosisoli TaxID=2665721 RepID=A0ABW2W0T1_9ACTN